MRIKIIPVLFLFLTSFTCLGQRSATITNVDFYLDQGKSVITITYNIERFNPADRFNIFPVIRKASGEKINAMSFTGDLNNVKGGPGKVINWDLAKDNIIFDDEIYVEVTGERIEPPVVETTVERKDIGKVPETIRQKKSASVNRGALFFQSLAFPGWGTSKLTGKNGHFVKGALGYGALLGSLLMNKKAADSYDAYKLSNTTTERNNLFNEARSNNSMAMILAGSATAIWSVDLISVLAIKDKSANSSVGLLKINLGYSVAAGHSHQFSCKINF